MLVCFQLPVGMMGFFGTPMANSWQQFSRPNFGLSQSADGRSVGFEGGSKLVDEFLIHKYIG